MKKKGLLILLGAILSLGLSSCVNNTNDGSNLNPDINDNNDDNNNHEDDNNKEDENNKEPEVDDVIDPTKDELRKEVINIKQDLYFPVNGKKINAYFLKDGHVPYVGVRDLFKALEGIYAKDQVRFIYNGNKHEVKYFRLMNDVEYSLTINYLKNTLTISDYEFFSFEDDSIDDYYINRFVISNHETKNNKGITINLNDYNINVFNIDSDVYIPLGLFNALISNGNLTNLVYNDKEICVLAGYSPADSLLNIRNKKLENTRLPLDVKEMRNNTLLLVLDNFYGLKSLKNYTSSKEYILSDPTNLTLFNSDDPKNFNKLLNKILIKDFDDPHTTLNSKSLYESVRSANDLEIPSTMNDLGPRTKKNYEVTEELYDLYTSEANKHVICVAVDTAYIKFDEFMYGDPYDIYDKFGNLTDDAWQYDTYALFKKCFDTINTKYKDKVKNVVFDICTNGGGVIDSAYEALGFLTNEDIISPSKNTSTKAESINKIKVDTDFDGDFNDDDAYTQFNYYILTSGSTFSAANYFTSIAKDMGIAKIIGQQSDGGMCAVTPFVLDDGTSFYYSGNLALQSATKNSDGWYDFNDIEKGIPVDIEIPLNKFYDYFYINDVINGVIK